MRKIYRKPTLKRRGLLGAVTALGANSSGEGQPEMIIEQGSGTDNL